MVDSIMSQEGQDKLTTLYTDKTVDFINRNADNPFFLYVPYTRGHIPLCVSDRGGDIKYIKNKSLYEGNNCNNQDNCQQ